MDIRVRFDDEKGLGLRRHFCLERSRVVRIDADGVHEDAPLFCPLCGGLTTIEIPRLQDRDIEKIPALGVEVCEHGYPDAPCGELAAGAFADYELRFRWGIPEYRVARLAMEFGPAGALWRWARPCTICRNEFLADRYGVIERELRRLCEALSKKSRTARAAIGGIQSDVNLVHALLDDLNARKGRIERTFGEAAPGYVYAITDGRAIKIGWSARHPGLPGGRLSQLQTAHPDELRLVGTFLASQQHETELHAKFAMHHIRGEWFRYVQEIVEHFEPP